MAMKLEVIITHDETSNKCSVEWSTASSENVTQQEKQTLSQVQKAVLIQFDRPINSQMH
ncbi:hypothetical protein [Providencia stuartii]|uniref:hypothetical protein n=1 Tax=Providencia stuartii TaxID=588 RepID=UPI0015DB4E84|nr:hypothetical protein [Providencia stuartii]